MFLRPRTLTRYLLAELGGATLFGILVWTALLWMNDLFFIANQAIEKDLGFQMTLTILIFKIPNELILAIPVGTLLGSLVAIGRMSADGEITALRSLGWGPRQLIRPMLLHGLAAFAAAFSIYVLIQPWASYNLRTLQSRILTARNISSELRPRVFFNQIPGYVLFVDDIPPGTQGLLDRAILYENGAPISGKPDAPEELIVAKKATLGPAAGGGGRLRIVFHDGVAHAFRTSNPESYRSFQFETFSPDPIQPPPWMRADDTAPDKTVADMSPRELVREVGGARADPDKLLRGFRLRAVSAEIHKRLALPFASFLFALLALPLGMTRVRSGKGAGFALSLGIVLLYWVVFMTGQEQASDGRIPVVAGIWAANALIAVWTVVAYLRLGALSGRSGKWAAGMADGGARLMGVLRRPIRRTAGPGATGGARSDGLRISAVIDRYIGVLFLEMLVLALAATNLIFILIEIKSVVDSVAERHQPIGLIFDYFKYFFPGALVLTLPFAAMIASVVAVTILSRHGEVTALKAAGMSARRICLPIIALTVLFCGVLYLVQDRIAPETNRKAAAVKDRIEGRNPRTYGLTPGGRWTFGGEGRLYHYRVFDPADLRFQGLSVFQIDLASARILRQWFCNSATWKDGAWQASGGWYRAFPEPGAVGEYKRFDKEAITAFDPPTNFTKSERTLAAGSDVAEQLSLGELSEQVHQLALGGYDTTRLRVEYWRKTASAATPLVTVLLALPFAFKVGRRGSMYGVGVGLVLAIVFWATAAIFNALGMETILPPFLAAWSPNVLYLVIGSYLLLFIPT
jgi:lipopolysaccharide export system permease protein